MNTILRKLNIPSISWKRMDFFNLVYWFLSVLIWEVSGHLICYKGFSTASIYVFPFCLLFALILTFLTRLCSEKWNRRWTLILTIFLFIFYATQIVYHRVFGSFYSVKMVKVGGTAMKKFWKETFAAILYSWWQILLLAIPFVLYSVRKRLFPKSFTKRVHDFNTIFLGIVILSWIVCVTSLRLSGTKRHSAFGAYHSTTIETGESVNKLGLATTMRLEITRLLFPVDRDEEEYQLIVTRLPKLENEWIEPYQDSSASSTKNVTNVRFESLDTYSYDERIQSLNRYLSFVEPTSKNEYTGIFKGRNLIEICAESFSPVVISKDLTPALYQLSHEGFLFTNFYTSFQNTTTNCEYALCMGLMPDLTRNKMDASFIPSANNYLPYCVGNAFKAQGYHTFAFHNNVGSFYQRNITHPNMGFECYFEKENYDDLSEVGMTFTNEPSEEPNSDLEMMQQSLPIIMEQGEPFVAYYMTYSGHYDYDFDLNPMCRKNRDVIEAYCKDHNLDYTDKEKAYLSCNLELEYALQYLLKQLEYNGMMDRTVIVLTTDHYPYGLNTTEYAELAGEPLEKPFGFKKNSFICWTGDMKEPVECDSYCCNIDILPTILNLFGINYDSRLLAGVDAFSDGPHIAFLVDESFLTNVMMYDSTEDKIEYFVDENKVPDSYFDTVVQLIQNKMNMSSLILYTNYYDLVFHSKEYVSPAETEAKSIPLGYWVIAVAIVIFVVVQVLRHLRRKQKGLAAPQQAAASAEPELPAEVNASPETESVSNP